MPSVYLGLGSNLGDRQENIRRATDLLSRLGAPVRVSSLYETEPVGFLDQPKFLNAACELQTRLGPFQILVLIKGIEATLGRKPIFRNAPRTIDIDILLFGPVTLQTHALTIPHPRLCERAFVLAPLAELEPGLVHPVSNKRIGELLEAVAGREGVRPWQEKGVA
ncbi:MAG: 2-amino-4-hydroxy-6-hydroxymethyldihydropteridine diphosphokinase [Chloroflexi bacterium]|nr:2-amino-4-hydroxy-6-hydroxymethyldihydropteridine diphosphokinase [Chloroflexota bacterium]